MRRTRRSTLCGMKIPKGPPGMDLYSRTLSPKERREFEELQKTEGIDYEVAVTRLVIDLAMAHRAPSHKVLPLINSLIKAVEAQRELKPQPSQQEVLQAAIEKAFMKVAGRLPDGW